MKFISFFILIGSTNIPSSLGAMKHESLQLHLLAEACKKRDALTEADLAIFTHANVYQCNYNECTSNFKSKHSCLRHIQTVHQIQPPIKKCPLRWCALWFLSEEKVKKHFLEMHQSNTWKVNLNEEENTTISHYYCIVPHYISLSNAQPN